MRDLICATVCGLVFVAIGALILTKLFRRICVDVEGDALTGKVGDE